MKLLTLHDPQKTNNKLYEPYESKNANKLVRFLPSCVVIDEDDKEITLLVAYRIWRRYQTPVRKVNKPGTKGHPWYNRWKYSLFDGTALALVTLNNKTQKFKVIKEKVLNTGNGKVDLRFVPTSNPNEFRVVYNTFGRLNPLKRSEDYKRFTLKSKCFYFVTKNKQIKYQPSIKDAQQQQVFIDDYYDNNGCTFQNKNIMVIDFKTLNYGFKKPSLICPNQHQRIEKNISMVSDRPDTYHYTIVPWTFLHNECKKINDKECVFEKIANFYDGSEPNFFKKTLQFSCSSPLVSFNDKEYVAVGHFKVKYTQLEKLRKNTKLMRFLNILKKQLQIKEYDIKHEGILHYNLIYGGFIYTVNKKTLRLERFTKCFIIHDKQPNALTFPSSIVSLRDGKRFLMAYHENDITLKFLHMTYKELNEMLMYTNSSKPNTIEFTIINL